nr:immunoglobulin heavy chain junction region [Macaca mulatta]MPN69610.1 immunoglobulin heavy chain junction region [Macaca mulatta]MPN69807.1 immunoglobulin heavy chain junction region [Macaca mulatta]MPN70216.1 immunoglobulin heavy chain junction region [Macaca mulatta]MPN70555.1 immunoglobulin heavy chain junction region [Macaca mulatta]
CAREVSYTGTLFDNWFGDW